MPISKRSSVSSPSRFEQISLWHLARCAEGANTISGRTAPKDKDDSGRGVSFADSLESLCGSAQTGAPYKLGDTTNMVGCCGQGQHGLSPLNHMVAAKPHLSTGQGQPHSPSGCFHHSRVSL